MLVHFACFIPINQFAWCHISHVYPPSCTPEHQVCNCSFCIVQDIASGSRHASLPGLSTKCCRALHLFLVLRGGPSPPLHTTTPPQPRNSSRKSTPCICDEHRGIQARPATLRPLNVSKTSLCLRSGLRICVQASSPFRPR